MKCLLACGLLFFSCSIVRADLLSSTAYIWPIPHGSEGAFSVVSLDGSTAHGEINAGVLQIGQTANFNTTDNAGEAFLTSDLTNGAANDIELHFGSNVATVDELSLVNQVPRLSAFDFAGYDISGYSLTLTSLAPGKRPTTRACNSKFLEAASEGRWAAGCPSQRRLHHWPWRWPRLALDIEADNVFSCGSGGRELSKTSLRTKKALPWGPCFATIVEDSGLEPLTSCMPCKRSPN